MKKRTNEKKPIAATATLRPVHLEDLSRVTGGTTATSIRIEKRTDQTTPIM